MSTQKDRIIFGHENAQPRMLPGTARELAPDAPDGGGEEANADNQGHKPAPLIYVLAGSVIFIHGHPSREPSFCLAGSKYCRSIHLVL